MIEISLVVNGQQFDHARPKPGRRIGLFLAAKFGSPGSPVLAFHLPTVSVTDNTAQIACHGLDLICAKTLDLELHVLRGDLADEDGVVHHAGSHCPLAKIG